MSTKKNDDDADLLDAIRYLGGGIDFAPFEFDLSSIMSEPEKKCECGADSIGVNKHSSWCPKETP